MNITDKLKAVTPITLTPEQRDVLQMLVYARHSEGVTRCIAKDKTLPGDTPENARQLSDLYFLFFDDCLKALFNVQVQTGEFRECYNDNANAVDAYILTKFNNHSTW